MAAQLTAQNRYPRRGPSSWMARATSSLPVPLSPSTSTANGAAAARSTVCLTASIAGLSPMSAGTAREVSPAGGGASRASASAWTAGAQAVAAVVSRAMARAASQRASIGHRHATAPIVRPAYRTGTAPSMPPGAACGRTARPPSSARSASRSVTVHTGPALASVAAAPCPRATTADGPRAQALAERPAHTGQRRGRVVGVLAHAHQFGGLLHDVHVHVLPGPRREATRAARFDEPAQRRRRVGIARRREHGLDPRAHERRRAGCAAGQTTWPDAAPRLAARRRSRPRRQPGARAARSR